MVSSKVAEYQSQIRRKLGERLEYCGGNVVVLFDELQKATPGTLDGEDNQAREETMPREQKAPCFLLLNMNH